MFVELSQIRAVLVENLGRSVFAIVLFLLAIAIVIYVIRQLWNNPTQEETWVHRLIHRIQRNMLTIAIILFPLALVGAVLIIVWDILPKLQAVAATSTTTTPTVEPTETAGVVSDTNTLQESLSFTVNLRGTVVPVVTVEPPFETPTSEQSITDTPTPINPYVVIDVNNIDYYTEPNGLLPYRFQPEVTSMPLSIVQQTSKGVEGTEQWFQVCCVVAETKTAMWITGSQITIENQPALKYVPVLETPTVVATPTPTAPYLALQQGVSPVNMFSGPGDTFPHVAQLGPNVYLEINGKTTDGQWLRVCCIDAPSGENTLWVRNNPLGIQIFNDTALNIWATPVLIPATPVPFQKVDGPAPLGLTNNFFTIYARVVGSPPIYDKALGGYFLAVEFQPAGQIGFSKRESTNRGENGALLLSLTEFSTGPGNVIYNYKYEYMPSGNFVDGKWQFWLTNAQGTQLSEIADFTTSPNQRGAYVAFNQVR